MNRRMAEEANGTDALADEAGTRAMVDLMLGTTALLLVVLLAVGAQAMRQPASSDTSEAQNRARLDALFAAADGQVLFVGADGVRPAGSDDVVAISAIAGSSRLATIARKGTPTLVIAPEGVEAAFHLTARLAALGAGSVRRVRLADNCAEIETVSMGPAGWTVSCRRR
jgi:hypothetical protein